MKRILILNWRCPKNPRRGGAELVTLEYARTWTEAGYKVAWLSGGYAGCSRHEISEGIEYLRYGNPLSIYFLAPFIYWLKFRGNFALVVDAIHGLPFFTPLWAWRSRKLAYIQEVAQEIWSEMFPFPLSVAGRAIEKFYFLLYRRTPFLTASQSTKNDLEKHGIPTENITVIPYGLPCNYLTYNMEHGTSNYQPATSNPQPATSNPTSPAAGGIRGASQQPATKNKVLTLLFVGRLVKMKGIDKAIDVFSAVVRKHKDSLFEIVGSGTEEYVRFLKGKVTSLGLADKCRFRGFAGEEEKIRLYRLSHFLVHTSVREGFGLVVLEANSQGTPVIAYDNPGLSEIVVDGVNGFKFSPDDNSLVADKIISLYNNPEKYSQLSASSLSYAKKFSWPESLNKSLILINEIIGI